MEGFVYVVDVVCALSRSRVELIRTETDRGWDGCFDGGFSDARLAMVAFAGV